MPSHLLSIKWSSRAHTSSHFGFCSCPNFLILLILRSFGVKLLSLLFVSLIVFLPLSFEMSPLLNVSTLLFLTLTLKFLVVYFVLLHPHEHTKLEPRGCLCCFLGFGTEYKSFRCWDPISKRLCIFCHVTFWKHRMFF